ncbi:MAG: hypothetical protein FWE80_05725 [Oscillospiraceae bacterium]|nr:hypothetical protein [Oscillospiraceae bacterium]
MFESKMDASLLIGKWHTTLRESIYMGRRIMTDFEFFPDGEVKVDFGNGETYYYDFILIGNKIKVSAPGFSTTEKIKLNGDILTMDRQTPYKRVF